MSSPYEFDYDKFTLSFKEEPHATRRKQILQAHPEVRKLFGHEPLTFPICIYMVIMQHIIAHYVQFSDMSWSKVLFTSFVISSTLTHALQMIVHELSHNLGFKTPLFNQMLSFICNTGTGLPTCSLFRRYHMDHHQFQGVVHLDTDIPIVSEAKFFSRSFLLKILWILINPFAYSIRPFIVNPKRSSIVDKIWIFFILLIDAYYLFIVGPKAFFYILGGSYMGLSFHPSAGHFIAEHYEFVHNQETYSYYGIMNWFNFNVGYHNEHHDFPFIPWSRLHKLKTIAPEFYDHLPHHSSYLSVFLKYIFDPNMSPFRRVIRLQTKSDLQTTLVMDHCY